MLFYKNQQKAKMKVLHFYKTYMPETVGGVEKVINEIARGSAKLNIETEVLCIGSSGTREPLQVDGHMVYRCRSNFELASTPFSVTAFFKFMKLVKKADVVHYHFPYPFADLLHVLFRVRKPSVVTYHSDVVKQKLMLTLYRPLMSVFFKSVDRVVATSPNYVSTSTTLINMPEKTSVIPIGINRQNYPLVTLDVKAVWRSRFGQRFFLFVGVLRYYKGLHVLIEAAKGSTYPIVIVGGGGMEVELKALASRAKVENIYFLGQVSEENKAALFELCYAVVFPSHLRSEAFGVSLLEGAMYGKPLISCEIGTGTTYINVDKETGLVIPPGDAKELRRAMDDLWDDEKRAADMGRNAESRYYKLFTADAMALSYASLYQELLKNDFSN